MKLNSVLLAVILYSFNALAQTDYIPSQHPVYEFLKMLSVKGVISEYNDAVLPLTRKSVTDYLTSALSSNNKFTETEKELAKKYYERFNINGDIVSLADNNWSSIAGNSEKRLYFYRDSISYMSINPNFDASVIYTDKNRKSAHTFNFGGRASGIYSEWFGFAVQASNGIVRGNRETALEDNRVKWSYAFNKTNINYFDETSGHMAFHYGILDVVLGRERILWGNGAVTRLVLSENPPVFDIIKLKLEYKSLSYNFLHGWLVQPSEEEWVDSELRYLRTKQSKYIALNRFGANFSDKVKVGLTQAVIYGNRPPEAAYFNPFLLWESAQRSLEDLDNSLLIIDSEFRPVNGLAFTAAYIFDDINFDYFDDWHKVSNRSGWQLSSMLAYPFVPENIFLKLEYNQIRPYTFSHHGIKEALTYTNNGYLLGYPYNPNSGLARIVLNYTATRDVAFTLSYDYLLHGRNINTNKGVVYNFGGDVFRFYRYSDNNRIALFEGEIEKQHNLTFSFDYEFLRNYSFGILTRYTNIDIAGQQDSDYTLTAFLKLFYE